MTDFSWKEILVTVFGGGGIVVALIQLLKAFFDRYDLKKKEKKEEQSDSDEKQTSFAVESRRLSLQEGQTINEQLWEIIKAKTDEIAGLKTEIKLLGDNHSLSRPTITKIYIHVRALRIELDALETLVKKEVGQDGLIKQMNGLRRRFDELQNVLP